MTPQNLYCCCCYSIDNQVNKLVAREKTLHLKGKSPNDRYWMPLALMIAAPVLELGEWGTKMGRGNQGRGNGNGTSPFNRYWMPLALMIAASVLELGEWGNINGEREPGMGKWERQISK